jgi:hypothetical protein
MRTLYDQAGVQELTGLSYAEFERDPRRALAQAGQPDALDLIARGFKPLLPSQARIRARLDAIGTEGRAQAVPAQSSVVSLHGWRRRA